MSDQLARKFHETYERLAPQFGYQTHPESAVAWEAVPEMNRKLMIAVCMEIQAEVDALVAAARVDAATTALDMANVGCFGHHDKGCNWCAAWDWTHTGAGTPDDAQKALEQRDITTHSEGEKHVWGYIQEVLGMKSDDFEVSKAIDRKIAAERALFVQKAAAKVKHELKTTHLPDGPYDDDFAPKVFRDHIVGTILALANPKAIAEHDAALRKIAHDEGFEEGINANGLDEVFCRRHLETVQSRAQKDEWQCPVCGEQAKLEAENASLRSEITMLKGTINDH